SVTFVEGSATLVSIALGSDGRASLAIPSGSLGPLSVGPHTLTVAYGGDPNYQATSPATVTILVAKAPTAVALTSGLAQLAQPVTLKAAVAVVSPGGAALGGTVDFSNSGAPIAGCSGVAIQSGIATCNTTFSQIGGYALAAGYSGDSN